MFPYTDDISLIATRHVECVVLLEEIVLEDYYYCDVYLEHDESGYYMEDNGNRWEYIPTNTDRIVVQPSLTKDGKIKYSPIQISTSKYYKETTDIFLKSGNEKKKIPVTWKKSRPYGGRTFADAE